jgi:hypothetical protein
LLLPPSLALGAGHQPLQLPAWSVVPFVLLPLCIALLPLAAGHFWHAEQAGCGPPSFFGYILYACLILLPILALVSVIFFRSTP